MRWGLHTLDTLGSFPGSYFMHKILFLLLIGALVNVGAWAQPGANHSPHGGSREPEPQGQREELRTLIRQQVPPQRTDQVQGGERRLRQLTPEERRDLRDQLRQQRNDNWRRSP